MSEEEEEPYIPITTNYLDVPQDEKLQVCYEIFKVSKETQNLLSEQNRHVFAEAFYEGGMSSLMKISMLALAKYFGTSTLPPEIKDNAIMMRIFYDSLSLDLPLSKIYCIMDESYWKRMVLQDRGNQTLLFDANTNWRNRGLSERFVKELEALSAEYGIDDNLLNLANKIKDFITEMHIAHLQSLRDSSFEKYFRDKNSDSSSESESELESDIEDELEVGNEEEGEEEHVANEEVEDVKTIKSQSSVLRWNTSEVSDQDEDDESEEEIRTETDIQIANIEIEIEQQKIDAHNAVVEARKKFLENRRLRIERREAKMENEARLQSIANAQVPEIVKKKKKKKKEFPSIFDIPLSESEEDIVNFEQIIDQRNPEEYLLRKKKYDYPPEHCHHVSLSFLQVFENLETLWIEFLGPRCERDFEMRHSNFSYKDVKNLCAGIAPLTKLKTFKLRNSKMDAKKLEILLATLQHMDSIEILDLGNDNLDDDCALSIYTYFKNVEGILSLELEGNIFKSDFLIKMAYGLYQYTTRKLQYLGLARTNLLHRGMHELSQMLAKTDHVQTLDLTAAWLEDSIISCCIAQHLIRNHKTIDNISLMAVSMSRQESIDIVTALATNQNILDINIRGCDMEEEIEFEIEVLLKRNRYSRNNPYIGHPELLVNGNLPKETNRLYARAVEKLNRQIECLNNRPEEIFPCARNFFNDKIEMEDDEECVDKMSAYSTDTFRSFSKKLTEPFVYDPNTFDEEEFYSHVKLPGPDERINYFRKRRQLDQDLYSFP